MLYGIFFVELIFLYFEGCFCEFVGICCAILILSLGSGSRWGFPCQSLALFMLKCPWPRNPKLLLIPYLFCHMVALCHWCFSLCCRATKAERSNQCRLFYLSMKKSENVSSVWERCIYKLMFYFVQTKSNQVVLVNNSQKWAPKNRQAPRQTDVRAIIIHWHLRKIFCMYCEKEMWYDTLCATFNGHYSI